MALSFTTSCANKECRHLQTVCFGTPGNPELPPRGPVYIRFTCVKCGTECIQPPASMTQVSSIPDGATLGLRVGADGGITDEQREAMLQLGDTESTMEMIPQEVIDELIAINLVYKRGPKHIDFTDAGELLYEKLASQL